MVVYAAAQFFGYGPTSNLFVILKQLKYRAENIRICLIENEATRIFYERNPGVADCLVKEIGNDAEFVISSFDPFSIVHAWVHNIPNVFYCNLFWYWDVFNNRNDLVVYRQELERLKKEYGPVDVLSYFDQIFKKNPHIGIFLGYYLAEKSLARKFPNFETYTSYFQDNMRLTMTNILMPQITYKPTVKESKIFIQLSGSRNPILMEREYSIYLRFIIDFALALSTTLEDLKFIVCINPLLIAEICPRNFVSSNLVIIPTLSQEENINMMRQSLAVFTSPGLETIYEAIHSSCPVFLIPEQNGGQFPIFKILNSVGYNPSRFLINEEFPERASLAGEDDAHEIYKLIEKVQKDKVGHFAELLRRAEFFVESMQSTEKRQQHIEMALTAIKSYMGDNPFNASETITNFIVENFIGAEQQIETDSVVMTI